MNAPPPNFPPRTKESQDWGLEPMSSPATSPSHLDLIPSRPHQPISLEHFTQQRNLKKLRLMTPYIFVIVEHHTTHAFVMYPSLYPRHIIFSLLLIHTSCSPSIMHDHTPATFPSIHTQEQSRASLPEPLLTATTSGLGRMRP